MLRYTLLRLLGAVPTLLLVIALSFLMVRLAPGGPFDDERVLPPETRENIEAYYRLDEPLLVQYGYWIGSVARLDFGNEFFRPNVAVRDELFQRLKVTVPVSTT